MKKINYFQNCNEAYKEILKTELSDVQSQWEVIYYANSELHVFPLDVNEIVTADFEKLTEWYFSYQAIINKKPSVDNLLIDRRKGKKSTLKVFDYNKYYPKIIKFFCENSSKMNFSACFYCDIHPIGQYMKNKKDPRLTVDLDHFYPKDQCPILALSLKNFIPSCQVCNSRIKGKTNFLKFYHLDSLSPDKQKDYLLKLSPSGDLYNFDENVQIVIYPKKNFSIKISFLENLDGYEIHFTSDENYEKEILALKLEQRYNSITILSEALSLLDLKRKFPITKINEIRNLMSSGKILVSEEQIEEIIFRKEYDKKRHSNLLKLKNDLLE